MCKVTFFFKLYVILSRVFFLTQFTEMGYFFCEFCEFCARSL